MYSYESMSKEALTKKVNDLEYLLGFIRMKLYENKNIVHEDIFLDLEGFSEKYGPYAILPFDSCLSQLDLAINLATQAHTRQKRKISQAPYIIHPLNVLKILIDMGANEELQITGVLHDTIEDTPVTLEVININFGSRIAEIIDILSEDKSKTWEERKENTISLMKNVDEDVLIVKYADVLDNLSSLKSDLFFYGEGIFDIFKRGKDKQEWYNLNLTNLFEQRLGEKASPLRKVFNSIFKG